jgi:hypothetical protein
MVAVDPLASLAPREILVRLAGRDYAIPPLPAIDWLEAILGGTQAAIIPSWFRDGQEAVFAAIMDGTVTDLDLDEATRDAVTVAAGRPWWWVTQLVGMAAHDNRTWTSLHGRMVLAGIDATRLPLAAWVDALYAAICELYAGDQEGRQRFDVTVDTPPDGVDIDEEEEGAAFLALAGTLGMDIGEEVDSDPAVDLYPLD